MIDVNALTPKQKQFITIAKWGTIVVAAALAAPIVFAASMGLIGLLIAGGILLVGINAAPVVSLKLANWKYRAIQAEHVAHIEKVSDDAAANPIETLLKQSADKRHASNQFREAITAFRTEVRNFENQVVEFGKQYPDDVNRFKIQLEAMHKLLVFRESRYKQLQVELDNFDSAIERAQAMWKMSQAAQKMNKLAGVEMGDPFEKIKADSAINSVMTSMNKAFAEMETALLDNKEIQQATNVLENGGSQTLAISSATKVGV